jgi:hypothetical protein
MHRQQQQQQQQQQRWHDAFALSMCLQQCPAADNMRHLLGLLQCVQCSVLNILAPYFFFVQAWVLGALQSEAPRPYYWAAALYVLPLLRNGLDQDWFSWTLLLLGAAHVQVRCTLQTTGCACKQHSRLLHAGKRCVCLHGMQWLADANCSSSNARALHSAVL